MRRVFDAARPCHLHDISRHASLRAPQVQKRLLQPLGPSRPQAPQAVAGGAFRGAEDVEGDPEGTDGPVGEATRSEDGADGDELPAAAWVGVELPAAAAGSGGGEADADEDSGDPDLGVQEEAADGASAAPAQEGFAFWPCRWSDKVLVYRYDIT